VHKQRSEGSVNTSAMLGKCARLRRELSSAYQASPRNLGYIQRLAAEIREIEDAVSSAPAHDVSGRSQARIDRSDELVERVAQPSMTWHPSDFEHEEFDPA